MGNHFVLGETIEAALSRAQPRRLGHQRYSYDMLGEGARTEPMRLRYLDAYARAIDAIGRRPPRPPPARPTGISIKLSALHPRYEAVSRARVMTELVPRVWTRPAGRPRPQSHRRCRGSRPAGAVARRLRGARRRGTQRLRSGTASAWRCRPTRRAPERDRVCRRSRAQPRPPTDGPAGQGRLLGYRDQARAGARARRHYPVFTRKRRHRYQLPRLRTRCWRAPDAIYPQFATHNALTCRGHPRDGERTTPFELQRLHGMGEALYGEVRRRQPDAVRIYAPVGSTATCWPTWCGGCWRTAPTPPSSTSWPTSPCRFDNLLQRRRIG